MDDRKGLYQFRESIIQFYKKQEYLIVPIFRFAVALSVLFFLRAHLGSHGPENAALESTLLNVILALVCTILPASACAGILSLVMIWDLYSLSLEATAVCAALILLCILIYFRFAPEDVVIMLLMPAACTFNLQYAVPILAGLLFGPGAAVPVVFGLLFTKFVLLVEESLPEISVAGAGAMPAGERLITNFRSLINGMMHDRPMIFLAAALALAVIIVCFLRHLMIEHAWTAAIAVGCIAELAVLLVGDMRFDTNIDLTKVLFGIAAAFVAGQIVRFFVFNVDYLRIENVQFEDEDYYYYVRAVPKTMVPVPVSDPEQFSRPEKGRAERE